MNRKNRRIIKLLLIPILLMAAPFALSAQAQNTVSGSANGGRANATATVLVANVNTALAPLAPVNLPAQGGSHTNQIASAFASLGTPSVVTVLSTGVITNSTSGSVTSAAHAESTSTVSNVSILGGLVTASTIRSKSTSDGNGISASSTASGSFANQLRIAGILYEQAEFAPNTVVDINANVQVLINNLPVLVPVTGTVTINAQTLEGNGTTTSSLAVTFLHVQVSGSVAGLITLNVDVSIASAASGVNFTAGPPPPMNHPPVLSVPGAQSVPVGNTLSFTVSATDPDAGNSITLSASALTNASFSPSNGNPASGQFSFTPSAGQVGSVTVTFTATDNHGSSVSASVQITVTSGPPPPPPSNRPPIISVPGAQTIEVGGTLTFTVEASDPDGDQITLAAGSLPANASFNAATGTFTFTPSNGQVGLIVTVTFTATDTKGASANAGVQITVLPQSGGQTPGPPVLSLPPSPIVIQVGQTLTFMVTGTSPNPNCVVSVAAAALPQNAGFDNTNKQFSFTPSAEQKDRSFVVTFTGTDCIGQTVVGTVTIIVSGSSTGGGGNSNPGPGHICMPITKIFFEAAPVNGNCGFIMVSIINSGEGMLKITSLKLDDGTNFRVEGPSSTPISLQSAGVIQIKIMFQPKTTGTLLDTLTIVTDDPDRPTVTIALKGKGKK